MLTPQEFEKLKQRLTAKPLDISAVSQGNQPSYLERVGGQYMDTAKNIISDIQRPAQSAEAGASPLEVVKQLGETGLRTAGNIAGAAFAPITEAVAPVIKPLVEKIASIPGVGDVAQKATEWATAHPEAAKDLGAVFNIGALLVGGKTVPKVAEKVVQGSGKISETVGQGLKTAGEKAYQIATPMEQSTSRAVQAYQAAKPTLFERMKGLITGEGTKSISAPITEAQTAARAGLSGTAWQIGVQAKKAAGNLWNKIISPALNASKERKERIDMRTFLGDLKKRIIAETPELSRRNSLLRAWEAIASDYSKVGQISLRKLQEYKSGWAKFVPERVYKGKPISGALNEVRNMAAQEARAEIYTRLGNEIKQAYLDYGNLQSIIEAGIKSIDPLRSKGVTKQVYEFLIDKTITPISSYGGKVLYKTGEGLEFIGREGAKKVGDLLKQ